MVVGPASFYAQLNELTQLQVKQWLVRVEIQNFVYHLCLNITETVNEILDIFSFPLQVFLFCRSYSYPSPSSRRVRNEVVAGLAQFRAITRKSQPGKAGSRSIPAGISTKWAGSLPI